MNFGTMAVCTSTIVELGGLEPPVPKGSGFTVRAATSYRLQLNVVAGVGIEPTAFR